MGEAWDRYMQAYRKKEGGIVIDLLRTAALVEMRIEADEYAEKIRGRLLEESFARRERQAKGSSWVEWGD